MWYRRRERCGYLLRCGFGVKNIRDRAVLRRLRGASFRGCMGGKDFKAVAGGRNVRCLGSCRGLFGVLFPARDFGEAFCIYAFQSRGGFGRGIQREISEKMAMFMALFASKGNMFIIYSLNPFKMVMEEAY